jgi:hypothetical protein
VRDGRATGEQAAAENQKDSEDDKSFHRVASVFGEAENCKRLNLSRRELQRRNASVLGVVVRNGSVGHGLGRRNGFCLISRATGNL